MDMDMDMVTDMDMDMDIIQIITLIAKNKNIIFSKKRVKPDSV